MPMFLSHHRLVEKINTEGSSHMPLDLDVKLFMVYAIVLILSKKAFISTNTVVR